ncbi:MOSC domain-containing protein, partial [Arthrobacter sp. GCM10027362]|uniref:MOSC domain-containing protein n=1 Tax=Arthrobacter sp. GCM10027362 TaxID=3273379 RepID=UPI003636DC30
MRATPEPGLLLAVCRVHALKPDAGGPVGVTAIDKRPAAGPVQVTGLGLHADVQADRKHHGGEPKALYAYAEEDARWWADELGREIPPGLFGENLRTAGVDVNGALIGERWRIGAEVVVEATSARIPCGTFARHMGEDRWVRRFTAAGRPGAYLRVLAAGRIQAGDAVEVIHRPRHGVSVA